MFICFGKLNLFGMSLNFRFIFWFNCSADGGHCCRMEFTGIKLMFNSLAAVFAFKPGRRDVQKFCEEFKYILTGDGFSAYILTDLAFPKFMTILGRCMNQVGLLHAGSIHGLF